MILAGPLWIKREIELLIPVEGVAGVAAAQLRADGKNVREVSMPCIELFEEQDAALRESVLTAAVRKRVVVEASSSFGWHKYTGFDGDCISIDRFGASAPGQVCLEKFGFTADNVVATAKALG